MQVLQNSTDKPIPFWLTINGGDFRGAAELSASVQVWLSKNGGDLVRAKGAIADKTNGLYWLLPNALDRDVVGPVALVILPPASIIAPAPGAVSYEVIASDEEILEVDLLTAINSNLSDMNSNLHLLCEEKVRPIRQGEIV